MLHVLQDVGGATAHVQPTVYDFLVVLAFTAIALTLAVTFGAHLAGIGPFRPFPDRRRRLQLEAESNLASRTR